MVNVPPNFETADLQGSTDSYTGTVGTSWTAIPTVAGNLIQSARVECVFDQAITNYLEVSLDNGTSILSKLWPGGFISFLVKGAKTQIYIRGNVASTYYKVNLNREAY